MVKYYFRYLNVLIGFPNGPVFRYGNFFILRVEKSSKTSPRAKNLVLPRAIWKSYIFNKRFCFYKLFFFEIRTLYGPNALLKIAHCNFCIRWLCRKPLLGSNSSINGVISTSHRHVSLPVPPNLQGNASCANIQFVPFNFAKL